VFLSTDGESDGPYGSFYVIVMFSFVRLGFSTFIRIYWAIRYYGRSLRGARLVSALSGTPNISYGRVIRVEIRSGAICKLIALGMNFRDCECERSRSGRSRVEDVVQLWDSVCSLAKKRVCTARVEAMGRLECELNTKINIYLIGLDLLLSDA
jgi:hypothetical protein